MLLTYLTFLPSLTLSRFTETIDNAYSNTYQRTITGIFDFSSLKTYGWKLHLFALVSTSVLLVMSYRIFSNTEDSNTESLSDSSSINSATSSGSKRSKFKKGFTSLGSTFMDGITNLSPRAGKQGFGSVANSQDPDYRHAIKVAKENGGFIGGLYNDGNTCFMNSVIQSLASSNELIDFLDSYTDLSDLPSGGEKLFSKFTSSEPAPENEFSNRLRDLIGKLNSKHHHRHRVYKTKELLRAMSNGPSKNLLLGYNQEDAQEFYQMVITEIEKDVKAKANITEDTATEKGVSIDEKFVEKTPGMMCGLSDLGDIGNVYVPAAQIDPNAPNVENKVCPFQLLTPLDGLSCERIGCLTCGEMGGLRYSVISGIGVNLPPYKRDSIKLSKLLDEWKKEEIIDDVECNRCGLVQIRNSLHEKLSLQQPDKLKQLTEERIEEIDGELKKKIINDDVYKRLHTKNMVKKSRKAKQIFFARPPSLLSMHINRSVFDPRSYSIRKNNSKVAFPLRLDMSDYVASPDDVNTDARLPFRKQDENIPQPSGENDEQAYEAENQVENQAENQVENQTENQEVQTENSINSSESLPYKSSLSSDEKPSTDSNSSPFMYTLKAVVSHFGTHNYGHYISFRKHRGVWWRVSDETVRVSTENEVLDCQGSFMLFYELTQRDSLKEPLEVSKDHDNTSDEGNEDEYEDNPPDSESSDDEVIEGKELANEQESMSVTENASFNEIASIEKEKESLNDNASLETRSTTDNDHIIQSQAGL